LGLIREKLAITQGSTVALNVLVMNLVEKLLDLLFVFFTALLRLLLVNEGSRSLRTVPLKPQIAAA
jgi:IS5 family transposase